MTAKYAWKEVMERHAGLQKHPEDARIVYAPNDSRLIVPLIRNGVIDAAIIPATHDESLSFAEDTWRVQDTGIAKFGGIGEHFFMRDGRLHEHFSGKRASPELESALPLTVRTTFHKLSEFFYPSAVWAPAAEIRRVAHDVSDFMLGVRADDKPSQRLFNDLGFWLAQQFPRRQTNLAVFWAESGAGKKGGEPTLRFDQGVTAHISGHAPLEYLVGGVTQEQWTTLRRQLGGETVEPIEKDPDIEARVRELNPGDMVVYGEGFVHRSSSSVREDGELSFAAAPYDLWPDI